MTYFQSIKENAFVIMMFVGLLQFVFTVFITLILHRNSKRQLRLEMLRSIDAQWQDLNKMIVSNPQIQQAIKDETLKDATSDQIIRMNIVYYSLNTFQQIIRAKEQGFISASVVASLMTGHINFLKQFPTEMEKFFLLEKGFDKNAITELKKYWSD
jgi:hypothetical protein